MNTFHAFYARGPPDPRSSHFVSFSASPKLASKRVGNALPVDSPRRTFVHLTQPARPSKELQ